MKILKAALMGIMASTISFTALANDYEKILGVTYDEEGITYQVNSGGCTSKDDFQVLLMETYPIRLALVRNNPDLCEGFFPYGTKVTFSYQELGLKDGDKATIENPLSTLTVTLN